MKTYVCVSIKRPMYVYKTYVYYEYKTYQLILTFLSFPFLTYVCEYNLY